MSKSRSRSRCEWGDSKIGRRGGQREEEEEEEGLTLSETDLLLLHSVVFSISFDNYMSPRKVVLLLYVGSLDEH